MKEGSIKQKKEEAQSKRIAISILDLYIQIESKDKARETTEAFWGNMQVHIWDQGMLTVRAGQKITHGTQQ